MMYGSPLRLPLRWYFAAIAAAMVFRCDRRCDVLAAVIRIAAAAVSVMLFLCRG